MLKVDDDLWVEHRPLRFMGVETGTRMTIVRLSSGKLFVHSPVKLDDALNEEIEKLGEVAAIVAPSKFHHLYVGEWVRAHPNAVVCPCPTLEKKRADIVWTEVLSDTPRSEWSSDLDQVFFGARSLENEVVFFHKRTRSLVCCDFIFDLANHPSRLTRFVTRMMGQKEPGATWLERVLIRDRKRAREQVERIQAWNAERIVLAHGNIIDRGGGDVVRRAYQWL